MALLDEFVVTATAPTDGTIVAEYPSLVEEVIHRQWEIIGHAPISSSLLTELLTEEEEEEYLRLSLDPLVDVLGHPVTGWAGVDFGQSTRTVRMLADRGVKYTCDWPNDDQPYRMVVPQGSMISLPVAIHLDDVFAHHRRGIDMERWARMVCEAFDRLYDEGATSGRLLVLSLHPWLTGQPFRIAHLRRVLEHITSRDKVWLSTGSEIVDAFLANESRQDGA